MAESRKLGKQMTVATRDMREVQVRASAMAKKVGEARKELVLINMAGLKKREELFSIDREEHRLTAKLEVMLAEEASLEETRTSSTAMVMDTMGRVADNIMGLGLFSSGDVRAGQSPLHWTLVTGHHCPLCLCPGSDSRLTVTRAPAVASSCESGGDWGLKLGQ